MFHAKDANKVRKILKLYYRKDLLFLLPSNITTGTTTTKSYQQSHDTDNKLDERFFQAQNLTAEVANPHLAKLSAVILLATIAGFITSDVVQFVYHITNLSLSIIAMLGATALYALSKERREILVSVDYSVLVFFAAMFVFTYGLWSSGIVTLVTSYFAYLS